MGPVQNAFHGIKKFLSHGFAFEKKLMSHARRRWKKLMSHGYYMFLKIKLNRNARNWERPVYMFVMLFCIYKKDHTKIFIVILYLWNRCIIVAYWKTPSNLTPLPLPLTPLPQPLFLYMYILNCSVEHSCSIVYL